MTHDELLAKISNEIDNGQGIMAVAILGDALRAVVELHKPMADWRKSPLEYDVCDFCGWEKAYPCPTIQVIEKELK